MNFQNIKSKMETKKWATAPKNTPPRKSTLLGDFTKKQIKDRVLNFDWTIKDGLDLFVLLSMHNIVTNVTIYLIIQGEIPKTYHLTKVYHNSLLFECFYKYFG